MRLRARRTCTLKQKAGRVLFAAHATQRALAQNRGLAVSGRLEPTSEEGERRNAAFLRHFQIMTEHGPVIVNPASNGCTLADLRALCGLTCEAVGQPRYDQDSTVLDALKIYQLDE